MTPMIPRGVRGPGRGHGGERQDPDADDGKPDEPGEGPA